MWVWVNSGSWWWTGRPGVLWFMGFQRVGHDWATELNWYNRWWPAPCLDREEAPKHFPKPNLHQKKVMVSVWWFAAPIIHYRVLNPGETITSEKYAQQINEMHRKLQRLQPALVNRKGPIFLIMPNCTSYRQGFENWMNWAIKFCLIHHILLPLLNWLPLLQASQQLFAEKTSFHNQQEAENAFWEFVKSESTDFYATRINKLLIGKNVFIVVVSILINKYVFEPSYVHVHSVVSGSLWPARLLCPWDSSLGENTGVGSFPSPGDLPDPGLEPVSAELQEDNLLLSHQGSHDEPSYNDLKSMVRNHNCFLTNLVTFLSHKACLYFFWLTFSFGDHGLIPVANKYLAFWHISSLLPNRVRA